MASIATPNSQAMFDQFNRLGEFVDAKIEQDYLVSIERQRRRTPAYIFIVGSILFFLANYVDYARLGPSDAYDTMLTLRSFFLVTNLIAGFMLLKGAAAYIEKTLTTAFVLNALVLCTVPLFRTKDRIAHELMATMSIFINLVVIPARMRTLLIMSLTYIIALPGFLAVFTELPSGDIVSAFIMTLGASVVGYLGAFRYRLPSRQVWAKNQLLNLEIDAHKTTLVAQQKLENTLRQQAFTDVLTGAHNRRSFFDQGGTLLNTKQQTALLMFDLDHFKKVNDTHGHNSGDDVLKRVVEICQKQLRKSDILARIGGEEFAILLPNTNDDEAANIAKRLREAVEKLSFKGAKSDFQVTISGGLLLDLNQHTDLDHALANADLALYEAKQTGRNQICLYRPTLPA